MYGLSTLTQIQLSIMKIQLSVTTIALNIMKMESPIMELLKLLIRGVLVDGSAFLMDSTGSPTKL